MTLPATTDPAATDPAATDPTAGRAGQLAAARRRVVRWTAAAVAAVALWVALTGGNVRSFAFLGVGIVLLWTADAVTGWWKLRRAPVVPADPAARAEAAAAQAVAARAQAAAAARHNALLAARPPRLTYGLLACVAVASAAQLGVLDASIEAAGLVKPAARAGEWWRLLTATYLHGGLLHFWFNFGALRALAPLVEAYAPRARLPLVYLAAGLAGNCASLVLLPNQTTIGASGAILGLVGYLLVLGFRRPDDFPPFLRRGMLSTLGLTAALGVIGFALIDNAGHAGGTAAGALIGFLTIPRAGTPIRRTPVLDALGWLAAAVLVAGAVLTLVRVAPLHFAPRAA
ncbi:hypothetical protein tb265_16840 [Gemmatimonadetes bacterium T265]|nr:hypothetical protein tb265_16840 [Gemmatimonadetes bacterium T265]